MKVITDYSDGIYSMKAAKPRQDWMDDAYWDWYQKRLVEIPNEEYQRYLEFLEVARTWNERIAELDNQAYDQQHGPEKKET